MISFPMIKNRDAVPNRSSVIRVDDLWSWYVTFDLINIWRFPCCIYDPSLICNWTSNFSDDTNFTFTGYFTTWPQMTFDLGMWLWPQHNYEGSHAASMTQLWLQLVSVWHRNEQDKRVCTNYLTHRQTHPPPLTDTQTKDAAIKSLLTDDLKTNYQNCIYYVQPRNQIWFLPKNVFFDIRRFSNH
jgi:hypothetical protein